MRIEHTLGKGTVHKETAKLMIYRENPAKIPVWQKIRQSKPLLIWFNRATAGGSMNVHVSQVRLKQ
jgi:hypothetical protein